MTVYELEYGMFSLYHLVHLVGYSHEEGEETKEHYLSAHNSGRGKGNFQGECYHCGKKGNREID